MGSKDFFYSGYGEEQLTFEQGMEEKFSLVSLEARYASEFCGVDLQQWCREMHGLVENVPNNAYTSENNTQMPY